jgi:hypothetical protein
MPAPKSDLKEVNMKRALRGARKAGVEVARVEVDKDGKITLIPGPPTVAAGATDTGNPWDAATRQA